MTTPILEARGLAKHFGHVVGLAGVDLQLHRGEVLAIIGDNGAGKSTLIKCLSGAYTLDGGELDIDGHQVNFRNVQDARDVGIAAWIVCGRVGGADPNAGLNYNLQSITAVVIGGTSLFGGRGLVIGSLIGALIVQVFNSGLALAGVDPNYQVLATGILVILAVSVDQWIRSVKA